MPIFGVSRRYPLQAPGSPTNSREHKTSILHGGIARRSQQREAQDSDELEAQQEDAAAAEAVREPAGADGEGAGADVRRDAHQLGLVGRVPHVLDDRGREQRERVDRAEPRHADQHVHVDLPVPDRLPHVLDVEVVREVAVVGAQAPLDFRALLGV